MLALKSHTQVTYTDDPSARVCLLYAWTKLVSSEGSLSMHFLKKPRIVTLFCF